MIPLTLALLLAPHPQDDAVPAIEPGRRADQKAIEDAVRERLDAMVGVAGDEVVLQRDLTLILYSQAFRERYERALGDPKELDRLAAEALQLRLQDLIAVQAGRTLGYDPELVDQLTKESFDEEVADFGGPLAYSALLRQMHLTPEDRRRQIQDQLLGGAWSRSVPGQDPGPTGRRAVDRFITPGWLLAAYEDFQRSSSAQDRELVGIRPERVRLQQLLIPDADLPDARGMAAEIRRQVEEEGADFGELVALYGEKKLRAERGISGELSVDILRALSQENHGSDALLDFAREAAPGDFLGPLETSNPDGDRGWSVYRLLERLPATEAQPFSDPDLQRRLRRRVQRRLDELRIRTAFRRFLERTYIYPPDLRDFLERSGGLLGR